MRNKAKRLIQSALNVNPNAQLAQALLKQVQSEQQYETPIKVETSTPKNEDGKAGDRKIIKQNNEYFLFIKVENRWMKTQLQEVK